MLFVLQEKKPNENASQGGWHFLYFKKELFAKIHPQLSHDLCIKISQLTNFQEVKIFSQTFKHEHKNEFVNAKPQKKWMIFTNKKYNGI